MPCSPFFRLAVLNMTHYVAVAVVAVIVAIVVAIVVAVVVAAVFVSALLYANIGSRHQRPISLEQQQEQFAPC
jgi:MFS superfamily sulfate permease-like transporter